MQAPIIEEKKEDDDVIDLDKSIVRAFKDVIEFPKLKEESKIEVP